MPDVISDTNGKLCVGSYHMWRLLSSPDNYSFGLLLEMREIHTGLEISTSYSRRVVMGQGKHGI